MPKGTPWTVRVLGDEEIYFYNSTGAASGPWGLELPDGYIRDNSGNYNNQDIVNDQLVEDIRAALEAGDPTTLSYSPDDLKER